MKITSLHQIRRLCIVAVLGLLASAVNVPAAPRAAGHSMRVRHCLDHATDGHRHARRHETSVKGLVLEETACQTTDFDRDGVYETQCSTTTHTYDRRGNRISTLAPSSDPNFPSLPTLFTYDRRGNQLTATSQYLQDANGDGLPDLNADGQPAISTVISTRTYDTRGNLLTATAKSDLGVFYASETFTYDAFDNVITFLNTEVFEDFIDMFSGVFSNTYDCKGNLIAQLRLYDYGNDGVVDGQVQSTSTYDARGHVLTEISTNPIFVGTRFIATYAYDRKGNLITLATLNDRNGNGIFDLGEPTGNEPNGSTINTYDRRGRLILVQQDDDNDGDGVSNSSSSIQYVY